MGEKDELTNDQWEWANTTARLEAKKRKEHIQSMERDWKKRRYGKTPEDQYALTDKAKQVEANWRTRRRETGTSGVQVAL